MTERLIDIRKYSLENCDEAVGVVIVVDVLRAFTTTAFAFQRGAREVTLVATVEEAFAMRAANPDYLLMGEVNGLAIEGFDLPNSPTDIDALDLSGRSLVMRSTAGTQGVVRAHQASHLFVASLAVAAATAERVGALDPDIVSFVETGVGAKGGGEEDIACADYIAALLRQDPLDVDETMVRVRNSRAAAKFRSKDDPDFLASDLEHALELDRFGFAMQVSSENDRLILRPTRP